MTGRGAWNRLFDETMATMRFDVDGKRLAIEQTLSLMQDADGAKRRAAATALAKTFKENLRTFTLITNTLAKDKEISDRWRGFKDIADARHLANRVEPEVVDALVAAVQAAYPRLSHRYYALKAKWFGKKRLPYWDRNAPLPRVATPTIAWGDAKDTVLTAYGAFSPRMAEIAERFFAHNWIDAPARPGKQSGAFAHPTVPSAHPYVLLNYQGKPRDVMTLAHELGHGVHQVLAAPNGALMARTPLTLARDRQRLRRDAHLQETARSDQGRGGAPRDARRQGRGHDQHGRAADRVLYVRAQAAHRAPEGRADRREAVRIMDERAGGEPRGRRSSSRRATRHSGPTSRISSARRSMSNAYAFGDCLVNSLYAVYEQANEGFAERYFAMLSAGGTKHHAELLKPFGLDARDPGFWQGGLGVIERLITELEALDAKA